MTRFLPLSDCCCLAFFSLPAVWRPGLLTGQPNAGQQLGHLPVEIPGNIIEVFKRSLDELEEHDDYFYSECDLQETKDQKLVVFHEWGIA